MEKMNKKGFVEVDIIGTVIIIILLILLAIALSMLQHSVFEITTLKQRVNNDLFLINLLRAKAGDDTLHEVILSDYSNEEFTLTKYETNRLLERAFGEKVCWKMIVDNRVINENQDCKKMVDLNIGDLDAKMNLPISDSEAENNIKIIEIRLIG